MTREDAKLKFRAEQYYTDDGDLVIPRPYAYDIIDEIFDEHEAQMKAKDEEIERLKAELKHYQEHSKNNAIISNLFLDL